MSEHRRVTSIEQGYLRLLGEQFVDLFLRCPPADAARQCTALR